MSTENANRQSREHGARPPSTDDSSVSIDDSPDAESLTGTPADAHEAGNRLTTFCVVCLSCLAALYTIFFARAFLLPIAVALLLSFLLSPLIRALGRIHLPAPAAAAVLVLAFVAAVAASVYGLAGPVETWMQRAPEMTRKAAARLRVVALPVAQVTRAANEVERVAGDTTRGRPTEVVVRGPTLVDRFLGTSRAFGQGVVEVVVLLYFLLAGGDLFLEKLVRVLPRLRDKRKAVTIARTIESSISAYLLTVTAINLAEGAVVAVALWALGMPTPYVWGAMLVCLEFIPFIGVATAVVVIGLAAATTFSSLTHALIAPAIVIAVNLIQAYVVSPLAMSKRLTLNPVALFIGLAFWWWVWGITGALLAVPLMATFKIFCDHITALAPVGEFLGGRELRGTHPLAPLSLLRYPEKHIGRLGDHLGEQT